MASHRSGKNATFVEEEQHAEFGQIDVEAHPDCVAFIKKQLVRLLHVPDYVFTPHHNALIAEFLLGDETRQSMFAYASDWQKERKRKNKKRAHNSKDGDKSKHAEPQAAEESDQDADAAGNAAAASAVLSLPEGLDENGKVKIQLNLTVGEAPGKERLSRPGLRKDIAYFLKADPKGDVSPDNIERALIIGNIKGGNPMPAFLRTMQTALAPALLSNRTWPDSIQKELSDVVHQSMASLTEHVNRMLGRTVLYVPIVNLTPEQWAQAHNDKELVQTFQTAMLHWKRQIREVVNERDVDSGDSNAGPLDEIEYWRSRASDLSNIRQQFTRPDVVKIVSVMSNTKEEERAFYLQPFLDLSHDNEQSTNEAMDNLRFLNTLEEPCKRLAAATPKEIPGMLKDQLRTVHMFLMHSRHYKRERFFRLLSMISNEIINRCRKQINLQAIFDGDVEGSMKALEESIEAGNAWVVAAKRMLVATRERYRRERGEQFEIVDIFSEINSFIKHRCMNLQEVCIGQLQFGYRRQATQHRALGSSTGSASSTYGEESSSYTFASSSTGGALTSHSTADTAFGAFSGGGINQGGSPASLVELYAGVLPCFGGAKGPEIESQLLDIQRTFKHRTEVLRRLDYDILDIKARDWSDDFHAFKNELDDLTMMMVQIISGAFSLVATVEGGAELLEAFHYLAKRDELHRNVERKKEPVFALFRDELNFVQNQIMKSESVMWLHPPYAGRAAWARNFRIRIEQNYRLLSRLHFLHPEKHDSMSLYRTLNKVNIEEYTETTFKKWKESLPAVPAQYLDEFLIKPRRLVGSAASSGEVLEGYMVNFPVELSVLIEEARYWLRMGEMVPQGVVDVLLREERLRQYRENVSIAVRAYNNIITSLPSKTRKLFAMRVAFLQSKFASGLNKSTWSSQGVVEWFVKECRVQTDKVQHLVDEFKHSTATIKHLCTHIGEHTLAIGIEKKRDYTLEEFMSKQVTHQERVKDKLCIAHREITNIMKKLFDYFRNDYKDSEMIRNEWHNFVASIDGQIAAALKQMVKRSLTELKRSMKAGEDDLQEKVSENPLFKLKVVIPSDTQQQQGGAPLQKMSSADASKPQSSPSMQEVTQQITSVMNDAMNIVRVLLMLERSLTIAIESDTKESLEERKLPWVEYVRPGTQATLLSANSGAPAAGMDEAELGAAAATAAAAAAQQHDCYADFLHDDGRHRDAPAVGPPHESELALLMTTIQHRITMVDDQVKNRLGWCMDNLKTSDDSPTLHMWRPKEEALRRARTGWQLKDYVDNIEAYKKTERKIAEQQGMCDVSFVRLDFAPMKETLRKRCNEWVESFLLLLYSQATEELESIYTYFESNLEKLRRTPKNLAHADEQQRLERTVRAELEDKRAEYVRGKDNTSLLFQKFNALELHGPHVLSDADRKRRVELPGEIEAFAVRLDECRKQIEKNMESFKSDLESDIRSFQVACEHLKKDLLENGPYNANMKPQEAFKKIAEYTAKVQARREKEAQLREDQKIVGLERPDQQDLKEIEAELQLLTRIWELTDRWKRETENWKRLPFKQLNILDMNDTVLARRKDTLALRKDLERREVWSKLLQDIDLFKRCLPVIEDLLSPALRDRHWRQLMVQLDEQFDPDSPEFCLDTLLTLRVERHGEFVSILASAAKQELSIEKELEKIKGVWETTELEIVEYHGSSKLASVDIIQTTLTEDVTKLSGFKMSPYVEAFKFSVQTWETMLSAVGDALDTLLLVQQKWMYLENIFMGGDDIKRKLPEDAKNFDTVNTQWGSIMARLAHDSSILKIARPDVVDISALLSMNASLEKIQKNLENFLDEKRRQFPRFFFLSNDDLLDILGNSKEPARVSNHLKKCFVEETPIALPDFTSRTIAQLRALHGCDQATTPFSLHSCNVATKTIHNGRAEQIHRQRMQKVVKLTFADGRTITCTPDHEFLLSDGTWRRADQIPCLAGPLDPQETAAKRNQVARVVCSFAGPVVEEPTAAERAWTFDVSPDEGSRTASYPALKYDTPHERERTHRYARLVGFIRADGNLKQHETFGYTGVRATVGADHDLRAIVEDIMALRGAGEDDLNYTLEHSDNAGFGKTTTVGIKGALRASLINLEGLVIGARVHQDAEWPAFVLDPACPVAVLREFLGGFFGGDGIVPSLIILNKSLIFSPITLTQTACEKHVPALEKSMDTLCELLERAGVPGAARHKTMKLSHPDGPDHKFRCGKAHHFHSKIAIPHAFTKAHNFFSKIAVRYDAGKFLRFGVAGLWWSYLFRIKQQWDAICSRLLDGKHEKFTIDKAMVLEAIEEVCQPGLNKHYNTAVKPQAVNAARYRQRQRAAAEEEEEEQEGRRRGRFNYEGIQDFQFKFVLNAREFVQYLGLERWFPGHGKYVSPMAKAELALPSYSMHLLSCEEVEGTRRVFDIGVADEGHNFVANGVVAHNCFEGMYNLELDKSRGQDIVRAMISSEGERVAFPGPIQIGGLPVEQWLTAVESRMKETVKRMSISTLDDLQRNVYSFKKPIKRDLLQAWLSHEGQAIILASQVNWTKETERVLIEYGHMGGVAAGNGRRKINPGYRLYKKWKILIKRYCEIVRQKLPKLLRKKLVDLITIEVHARDILNLIQARRISSVTDFDWIRQLRFYREAADDHIVIRQTSAQINYDYEYLGVSGRLVVTALTDRAYMTLTTALQLFLGGLPQGPAGTGKTETVKDLAKGIGKYCIAEGTLVTLEDGSSKPIEQVTSADRVLTWDRSRGGDSSNGGFVAGGVTHLLNQGRKKCIELTFSDGRTVTCTPDHKLLLANGTWQRADQIPLLAASPLESDVVGVMCGPVGTARAHGPNASSAWKLKTAFRTFTIKTQDELERTRAFARLLGAVLSAGGKTVVTLSSKRDRDDLINDIESICPGASKSDASSSSSSSLFAVRIGGALRSAIEQLDGDSMKSQNQQQKRKTTPSVPAFLASPDCPLAVLQSFLAALFGGCVSAPPPSIGKSDDGANEGCAAAFVSAAPTLQFVCRGADDAAAAAANMRRRTMKEVGDMLGRFGIASEMSSWPEKKEQEQITIIRLTVIDSTTTSSSSSCGNKGNAIIGISSGSFMDRIGIHYCWHKRYCFETAAAWRRYVRKGEEEKQHVDINQGGMCADRGKMMGPVEFLERIGAGQVWILGAAGNKNAPIHDISLPTTSIQLLKRRDAGVRRVYDISVDHPSHGRDNSFLCNGLTVHNCLVFNCFVAGTKILMADGSSRKVEDLYTLALDEQVMLAAYDKNKANTMGDKDSTTKGVLVPSQMIGKATAARRRTVRLTLSDGRTITCTPDHLFPAGDGSGRMVKAEDIVVHRIVTRHDPEEEEEAEEEDGVGPCITTPFSRTRAAHSDSLLIGLEGSHRELDKTRAIDKRRKVDPAWTLDLEKPIAHIYGHPGQAPARLPPLCMTTQYDRDRANAFARVVGYIMGDGGISLPHAQYNQRHQVCVYFGAKQDAEAFQRDYLFIGGGGCCITWSEGEEGDEKEFDDVYKIAMCGALSEAIANLRGMCVGHRVQNMSATWPDFVKDESCPLPVLRNFLAGLFGADGCCPSLARSASGRSNSPYACSAFNPIKFAQTKCNVRAANGLPSGRDALRTLLTEVCKMLERAGVPGAYLQAVDLKGTDSCKSKYLCGSLCLPTNGGTALFYDHIGISYCTHKEYRIGIAAMYDKYVQRAKQHYGDLVAEVLDCAGDGGLTQGALESAQFDGGEPALTNTSTHEPCERRSPAQNATAHGRAGAVRRPREDDREDPFTMLQGPADTDLVSAEEFLVRIGARYMFNVDKSDSDEKPAGRAVSAGSRTAEGKPLLRLFVIDRRDGPTVTTYCPTVEHDGHCLVANGIVTRNCGDGLDYKSLGRMFSGLAQTGAWSCFDEFNRIVPAVLSVVAQQISTILSAVKERKKNFVFEGVDMKLNLNTGIFVTMNPGYAGRSELPDNLKALLRPISMMQPDFAMISEITLLSQGFAESNDLSKKVAILYQLMESQLSKQDHYDFSLRNIKAVLVQAGNLKRENFPGTEQQLCLKACNDMNLPKFVKEDVPLFLGMISDLFPKIKPEGAGLEDLQRCCNEEIDFRSMKRTEHISIKTMHLWDTLNTRHGVMCVGQAASGKTTTYEILAGALKRLKDQNIEGYEPVRITLLNPKALSMDELYGSYNQSTREWCFTGDTPVTMADGTACPIRDIKVGDVVAAYHEGKGIGDAEVTQFLNRGKKKIVELKFSDGRTVRCTPDHKFMVEDGSWCQAKDLQMTLTPAAAKTTKAKRIAAGITFAQKQLDKQTATTTTATPSVLGCDEFNSNEKHLLLPLAEQEQEDVVDAEFSPLDHIHLLDRRDAGEEDTYDITIKEHHNFLANGLVAHNCDGVVSKYMRIECNDKTPTLKWMLFDGPVDTLWIESMNTVLDDNKMLTLNSGERIQLTPQISMLFEVQDLAAASPATVSRCGMVYFNASDMGWQPYIYCWLKNRYQQEIAINAPKPDTTIKELQEFINTSLARVLEFRNNECTELFPTTDFAAVRNFTTLFDAIASPETDPFLPHCPRLQPQHAGDNYVSQIHMLAVFAMMWAFGGTLNEESRRKFDAILRDVENAIPSNDTAFDYYVDLKSNAWRSWDDHPDLQKPFTAPEEMPYYRLIVPTVDTIRHRFVVGQLVRARVHVVMVGESGTGKSLVAATVARDQNEKTHLVCQINFSAQTSAKNVQDIIEGKMDTKSNKVYMPPNGRKMVLFIEDLNMPAKEEFGAQPPLELLRLWVDNGFWFDRKNQVRRQINDMQIMACMTAGRPPISMRLLSKLFVLNINFPSDNVVTKIFNSIMMHRLSNFENLRDHCDILVKATMQVYQRVTTDLLPIPSKSHYVFNLRDLSKVFGGIYSAFMPAIENKEALVTLWMHECFRVFSDRMNDLNDKVWFRNLIIDRLATLFSLKWNTLLKDGRNPIFVDFWEGELDEFAKYKLTPGQNELKAKLDEALDNFNSEPGARPMDLVFFDDAVEHLCRIHRIIRMPRGNALLVGLGGSGRSSLTRLACYLAGYSMFTIEIHKKYDLERFHDDLRVLYRSAGGTKSQQRVFFISDTQIMHNSFLEDINNMLSVGEVPNLFVKEERRAIVDEMTKLAAEEGFRDSADDIFSFFIDRARRNIHMCIALSPAHKLFRIRLRQFPTLINQCNVDWFVDWPAEALKEVSSRLLGDTDLGDAEVRDKVINTLVYMHETTGIANTRLRTTLKRYNYITPTSYLELVRGYVAMLDNKRYELSVQRDKLRNGMAKLEETKTAVARMQAELMTQEEALRQKTAEVDRAMRDIHHQQQVADEQQANMNQEKIKIEREKQTAEVIKTEAQGELDKAMPMLNDATAALDSLRKDDITEVKSFSKPPELVQLVMMAVQTLLRRGIEWDDAKKTLNEQGFLEMLKNYKVNEIPDKMLNQIEKFVKMQKFDVDLVRKSNVAAAGMCKWVIAVHRYGLVYKEVAPKMAKLEAAAARVRHQEEQLALREKKLAEILARVKKLQEDLQALLDEKKRLQDAASETAAKLERANIIVSGLEGERDRWTRSIENFQLSIGNLVGDGMLACGVMSYAGAFPSDYRDELVDKWSRAVRKENIPMSKVFDFVNFLVDPTEVRDWQMMGLPGDDFSRENAVIVTRGTRWTLMIDPQGQANRWIKRLEKDNGLKIVDPKQGDFLKSIEYAVQFGVPVLLQDVSDELDPSLDSVVSKAIVRKAGRTIIKIGDNVIDYNENFRLYMTTRLANPHYTPETCTKACLLNFAVKEQGLEEQLLKIVVEKEKPDLEIENERLIMRTAAAKKKTKQLQDEVLDLLNNSKVSLLENVRLIETLQTSKQTEIEITAQLKEAEILSEKNTQSREQYRECARRASVLYFVLADLGSIDSMYQFALDSYIILFQNSIKRSADKVRADTVAERVTVLNEWHTGQVYSNTCRGLFEDHKLLFSFHMTVRILAARGDVNLDEFAFFMRGGVVLDREAQSPNPAPQWLSKTIWDHITELDKLVNFHGITASFEQLHKDWHTNFFLAEKPEEAVIPAEWEQRTSQNYLQRMILVRCLRPDRLLFMVVKFIEDSLGRRYVEPPPFNLAETLSESKNVLPLIFVLSPGVDPTTQLKSLADVKNQSLKTLALGQGQDKAATKLIYENAQSGGWVFLANAHLMPAFLEELEKIIDNLPNLRPHDNFRLWISSVPTPLFPIGILQRAIKMTTEPPQGLKSNLIRLMNAVSDDQYITNSGDKPHFYRPLFFALCFFHSVLLERKKFGTLGYNVKYDFNFNDFEVSTSILALYVGSVAADAAPTDLPFVTMRYLIAEATYGGRVTDDWDRRLINVYIESFMNPATVALESSTPFMLSEAEEYYIPPESPPLQIYRDYCARLPLVDTPLAFGQHSNADIASQIAGSAAILDNLMNVNANLAKSGGGGGSGPTNSIEEKLLAILTTVDDQIPPLIDFALILEQTQDDRGSALNTCLLQEIQRYNVLLTKIRRQKMELRRAVKGEIVMNDELDVIFGALLVGKVPMPWQSGYPSLKPLSSWTRDLIERVEQLIMWGRSTPKIFWLAGFTYPGGFLKSLQQQVARRDAVPINQYGWEFFVLPDSTQTIMHGAREGAYVKGIYLEGAAWNHEENCLTESTMMQLVVPMPIIHFKPKRIEVGKRQVVTGIYSCPLYYYQVRTGSRERPSFMLAVDVASGDSEPEHWTKRGTALLLSTAE